MTKAVAMIDTGNIKGDVFFIQPTYSNTIIHINLKGFKPNKTHAIHIHEYGDLRKQCTSCGGHYNPHNKSHGSYTLHGKDRHVGDMINNFITNNRGEVNIVYEDDLVKLRGPYSVIGRSIVIHEGIDDLGEGKNKDSLITGNAGKRIACAVIGITR